MYTWLLCVHCAVCEHSSAAKHEAAKHEAAKHEAGLREASMREARACFAELLDGAERGNITLITRHGHAAAAVVPVTLLGQLGKPGELPLRPDDGRALEAAVASLRSALQALETLAGPATRRPSAARRPGAAGGGRARRAARGAPGPARTGRPRHGPPGGPRRPGHGVVELPLRLFWSAPDRTFDLDQPPMLRALYEAVLREASRPDDLVGYLNGEILVAVWPDLFLPKGVRRAWEDQHPELRAARLTAA